jgi:hypothetical protein
MSIKLNKELAYKTILNERGHPHSTSIELLEEILNQYQLKLVPNQHDTEENMIDSALKGKGWETNYKYFKEKFCYSYAKVRYGFWRLEAYNLIERKVILAPKGQKAKGSSICILLNLKNIKKLLSIKNTID